MHYLNVFGKKVKIVLTFYVYTVYSIYIQIIQLCEVKNENIN